MIETTVNNKQTKKHLEKKCHCCVFSVFSLLPVISAEGEGSVTCTALLRLCAHIRMQCAADTGMGFVFK